MEKGETNTVKIVNPHFSPKTCLTVEKAMGPAADYANYADADYKLSTQPHLCIRVICVIRG